jgi:L-rhamnose mutarotase
MKRRHQGVPEKELTNLSKEKGERAASIYLHDRKLQHVLKSGRAKIKEQFNSVAPSQAKKKKKKKKENLMCTRQLPPMLKHATLRQRFNELLLGNHHKTGSSPKSNRM